MSECDLADRQGFHPVSIRRWAGDKARVVSRAASEGAVDGISCRRGMLRVLPLMPLPSADRERPAIEEYRLKRP
jgi:hypothetical protein